MNNNQIIRASEITTVKNKVRPIGSLEKMFSPVFEAFHSWISSLQQVFTQQTEEIVDELKAQEAKIEGQQQRIDLQQQQIEHLTKRLDESEEALKAKIIQEARYDGYVNLTEFGARMMPAISSHRVARLFKVVGLAKKRRMGRTEPYFRMIKEGYAKRRVTIDGHVFYVWHHALCTELIEKWLTDHDLYYVFQSHKSTEEREKFIDQLFWDYVIGLGAAG